MMMIIIIITNAVTIMIITALVCYAIILHTINCLVLLSPKTPLVGEMWDYQDQQVFKSLLHSLQCGDHVQS